MCMHFLFIVLPASEIETSQTVLLQTVTILFFFLLFSVLVLALSITLFTATGAFYYSGDTKMQDMESKVFFSLILSRISRQVTLFMFCYCKYSVG